MKQNKKGFTLVELLAVIVILAIIALIATPIILNVIDTARTNAAINSAYGYMESIEKSVVINNFSADAATATIPELNGTFVIQTNGTQIYAQAVENGSLKVDSDGNPVTTGNPTTINFKGDAPKDNGTIKYEKGKVTGCTLTVNNVSLTCDANGKVSKSAS